MEPCWARLVVGICMAKQILIAYTIDCVGLLVWDGLSLVSSFAELYVDVSRRSLVRAVTVWTCEDGKRE